MRPGFIGSGWGKEKKNEKLFRFSVNINVTEIKVRQNLIQQLWEKNINDVRLWKFRREKHSNVNCLSLDK